MSRKAFTAAVVAATIAWSIGLSVLLAPLSVQAAPAAGSLVKASLPAVYYVGGDGKRYVFPNEKTYKTWYADFSTVMTITDAELAALAIGGNATYKPGVRMVKITTDPKVYAVAKGGSLRWVSSEAVAVALYGASWNQMIDDVPDAFFTNYTVGADIASASSFSPAGEQSQATSINVDKNLSGSVVGGGSLSSMLSSAQPAGGSLPGGATGVNMLKVDVRNGGSSAMVVDSATVRRTGSGAAADFANVYVYEGNNRLTTGRTLNTTSHEASFGGLNLSLAAGETKSLWIAADFVAAPGAGNTNAMSLVDLRSGSNVAAGLPLSGPTFTMATAAVGTVTITRSGALPLSNVKAGGLAQKIAEFQLTAGAAEDVDIAKIALFRGGAVSRTNMSNLALKQAGSTLATVTSFDANDRATFVLSTPMRLEKGALRTFEVYADISAASRAGAAETILTYLDQSTDLTAVGRTYNYGVRVLQGAPAYDGTGGCALGAGNCSSTRVEGGQVTITYNGPSAKDAQVNGKDVELYNFTLAAAANLEVRNLRTQITWLQAAGAVLGAANGLVDTAAAPNVANFTDIKIVDTASGAIVAGPRDACLVATATCVQTTADTIHAITYTEVITLAAGQSRTFKVTADVANQVALADNQVRFDLLPFAGADIRNLDNSTNVAVTDIVPNTGINGNLNTLRQASLTVSLASTPSAQTYIQGGQGVTLLGLSLKAGDASDVKVSTLVLQGQFDGEIDADAGADGVCDADAPDGVFQNGQDGAGCNTFAGVVQSMKLWNGSTQLGTTKSPAASTGPGLGGDITFDSLNLTIPKGQTVTLTATGNLGNALANLNDDLRLRVTAAGSVTATDADGNAAPVLGLGAGVNGPTMRIAAAGLLTVIRAADDTESEASVVVGNSSNTVLAKYKFTAQNEELKLVKARINVATPAGVSSLSLYDGSTLVGGPASVSGAGNADFSGMNFVIPKDGNKTLTVKGNLSAVGAGAAPSGSNVVATLFSSNQPGAASTFEVRGTSAGSNTLIVNFGAAPVAAVGTYTVVGDATTAADTFSATIAGGVCTTAPVTAWAVSDAATATALAAAITAQCAGYTAAAVGNVITVTATVAGTASNRALTSTVVSGGGGVAPTGVTTGIAGGTDATLLGNAKILRKTKPTIALVNPLPNITLADGDKTLMRFTVSADGAGDLSLKGLSFAISKTTAVGLTATAGSSVRRSTEGTNLAGAVGSATACTAAGSPTCDLNVIFATEEQINFGTSRTYDLIMTVDSTPGTSASVSTRLQGDAATSTGAITAGTSSHLVVAGAGGNRNFVWSDLSILPHLDTVGASSADWATGFLLKVLQTDQQTMSK